MTREEKHKEFLAALETAPIMPDMEESTVIGVVERLADGLVANGAISVEERGVAVEAVEKRERDGGSTALSCGLVIPHARLDNFARHLLAIGTVRNGFDCGAMDGAPSRIFIMILNPKDDPKGHVTILSAANKCLIRPEVRERVLMERDGEAIRGILREAARQL